jgi:hypothetical protein
MMIRLVLAGPIISGWHVVSTKMVLVLSRTLLHTLLCSCLVFVVVDSTEGKWMNEKKNTRERRVQQTSRAGRVREVGMNYALRGLGVAENQKQLAPMPSPHFNFIRRFPSGRFDGDYDMRDATTTNRYRSIACIMG